MASTGPWSTNYNGVLLDTTWKVYEIRDSSLVKPLADRPVVWTGVKPAQTSWLKPAATWYDDPAEWDVVPSAGGPADWTRVPATDTSPEAVPEPATTVSDISQTDSSLSFHVDRVGTPVEVKVSYFPNWQASGAEGPWRVAPNLMVVVPTSHDVTLNYGIPRTIGQLRPARGTAHGGGVGRHRGHRGRSSVGPAGPPCPAVSRTMGMFPLSTVLFPHAALPLHVFEERYKALMGDCMATDGAFGVVLIARGSEVGGGDERVDVGTIARVTHLTELEDGRMLVMARGVERVLVERWLDDGPYPRAEVG